MSGHIFAGPRRAARESGRPHRRLGRAEHARLAVRRACSARRPSRRAARTSRCGSSAAGDSTRRSSTRRTGSRRATRRASPWAATCRRRVEGADLRDLGGQGSDFGQPGPDPGRQGMVEERPELREDLRRRLVGRPEAGQVDRQGPGGRQHGRHRERHVHEHDRGRGAQDRWTDPEFDPSLDAFYYARVLEIPTPRWTTLQAKELGIAPPDVVPATIQERAWTSPIWYTPPAGSHAAAGMTVADLKAKGGALSTTRP